jgi:uncharacterized phage infection (PIP) family protein YhgE
MEDNQKPPLFWTLFGGSVFSVIFVLILAIFGYVINNINSLQAHVNQITKDSISRTEIITDVEKQRDLLNEHREKLNSVDASVNELKDKAKESITHLLELKSCQEKLASCQEKLVALELENKNLREQISQIREKLIKLEPKEESKKNE